mgnify:CR=1 FL=1
MSKRERSKKASVRREKIKAKKEVEEIIKSKKRDQFGWQAKKVNI